MNDHIERVKSASTMSLVLDADMRASMRWLVDELERVARRLSLCEIKLRETENDRRLAHHYLGGATTERDILQRKLEETERKLAQSEHLRDVCLRRLDDVAARLADAEAKLAGCQKQLAEAITGRQQAEIDAQTSRRVRESMRVALEKESGKLAETERKLAEAEAKIAKVGNQGAAGGSVMGDRDQRICSAGFIAGFVCAGGSADDAKARAAELVKVWGPSWLFWHASEPQEHAAAEAPAAPAEQPAEVWQYWWDDRLGSPYDGIDIESLWHVEGTGPWPEARRDNEFKIVTAGRTFKLFWRRKPDPKPEQKPEPEPEPEVWQYLWSSFWHDEGTGPWPEARKDNYFAGVRPMRLNWRRKPAKAGQP